MGPCCADDPARATRRTPPFGRCPRGFERDFLRVVDRLPMEGDAERFATQEHGALLFHVVGLGTLDRIHDALYVATRDAAGREPSPTVAIIDSQSSKAAQKGALHSTRRALMRARRLRAASAIFSSTHSASYSA